LAAYDGARYPTGLSKKRKGPLKILENESKEIEDKQESNVTKALGRIDGGLTGLQRNRWKSSPLRGVVCKKKTNAGPDAMQKNFHLRIPGTS